MPRPAYIRLKKALGQRFIVSRKGFLARRPHRSFRLTRRRDYMRSLRLPGYLRFTAEVLNLLWTHRNVFLGLALIYALLTIVFVGLSSQDAYNELAGLLDESKGELLSGAWGSIGAAGLLLLSGIGGSFAPQLTNVQQVYAMLAVLLIWLSTVWLLRAILSGKRPALRDAIYGSGAPLVASGLVFLVIFVQLLPIALAAIVVNTAVSTGFIDGGLLAMLLWLIVGLLAVLSLYWITSTIMALVIVTLPGMYPWQAIRAAGDLVIGRRLRILIRLLWLIIMIGLFWVIVVLPAILLDGWLRSLIPWFDTVPFVPIVILLVTSIATVVSSSYVYLLYRKVVDDDADPA